MGKAADGVGRYSEAKEVLGRVTQLAPYNNIAKKNLGRLEHLETRPASDIQGRKVGGAPRLFIEESGKSGTTLLRKSATGQTAARIAPGEPPRLRSSTRRSTFTPGTATTLGRLNPSWGLGSSGSCEGESVRSSDHRCEPTGHLDYHPRGLPAPDFAEGVLLPHQGQGRTPDIPERESGQVHQG